MSSRGRCYRLGIITYRGILRLENYGWQLRSLVEQKIILASFCLLRFLVR